MRKSLLNVFFLLTCLVGFSSCNNSQNSPAPDTSATDESPIIEPVSEDEGTPTTPATDENVTPSENEDNTDDSGQDENSNTDDNSTTDDSDNSTSDNSTLNPTPQTFYADADGDNFGDASISQDAVTQPSGYVLDNTDCDDSDATIHPGALEDLKDTIDQDCTGTAQMVIKQVFQHFELDGVTLKPAGPKSVTVDFNPVTFDSRSKIIFVNNGKICSRVFRDNDLIVTNLLEEDGNCDGSFASASDVDSVFDVTGELVQSRTVTTQEDQDGDGNFLDDVGTGTHIVENYLYTYTFHADGVTPATRDGTRNGLPSAHVEFDEQGRAILVDEDKEDKVTGLYDGIYDVHTEIFRDANGFVVNRIKTELATALTESLTNDVLDAYGEPVEQTLVREISTGVFDSTLITVETTYLE